MTCLREIPILPVIFSMLFTTSASAQSFVNTEWEQLYSAPDTIDWSASTVEGGQLITVSNTIVSGEEANILLTKFFDNGTIDWQVDWDGAKSTSDYGVDVVDDGGYIYVTGASEYSNDSTFDIVLLKFNQEGDLIWEENYDGTGGSDYPVRLILDTNGNIYITGTSDGTNSDLDFITLKYDTSGTFIWDARYDYNGYIDISGDIVIDADHNVVVTGGSEDTTGVWDYTTVSYNASGSQLYVDREPSGETGTDIQKPKDLVKDSKRNYYITGVNNNGSDNDIKLVKLDSTLNPTWVKIYDNANEGSNALAINDSGDIYIGGWQEADSGIRAFLLLKYDKSGNLLWDTTLLPQPDKYISAITNIHITQDTLVNVIGFATNGSNSDIVCAQFSDKGGVRWLKVWENNTGSIDYPLSVSQTDGEVFVTGRTTDLESKWVTIKYSYFHKDQPIAYIDDTIPYAIDDEILIRFNPQNLLLSSIDNTEITWGSVNDFLDSTAISTINTKTELGFGNLKCYKVFPSSKSTDTISVGRLGDTLESPPFYATFGVILPNGSNDSIIIDSLNASLPYVIIADINGISLLDAGANDPYFTNGESAGLTPSTSIPAADINIEDAWDYETGDPGITVAVFDCGINYSHADISGPLFGTSSVIDGYDYINNTPILSSPNPDNYGHGSVIAGIIGAWRNNNFGIAGIAGGSNGSGGVSLMAMKIVEPQGRLCKEILVSDNTILNAMKEAVNGNGKVNNRADIQNHSWGFSMVSPPKGRYLLHEAFIYAYDQQVVVVASAGNQGDLNCSFVDYPSCYRDHMIIRVGANDATGYKADFSQCGFELDFIAPGTRDLYIGMDKSGNNFTDIISSGSGAACSSYINGTSFSAPHASGVAALLLSYANNNPVPNQLSPEDCEQIMERSATDLYGRTFYYTGWDDFSGWGRINAGSALESIRYPDYLVKHYSFKYQPESAILVGQYEKTCLEQSLFGERIKQQTVNRYEFTATNGHTIPQGYEIVDAWARGSSSTTLGVMSIYGAANCGGSYAEYYLPSERDAIITNYNSSAVTMKGYTYEILKEANNAITAGWWPFDKFSEVTFAYTLYLRKTDPTGVTDQSAIPVLNAYPNPTSTQVIVELSNLNAQIGTHLLLTDMSGRLIKVLAEDREINSKHHVIVSTEDLNGGLYLLVLQTKENSIVQKLLVIK